MACLWSGSILIADEVALGVTYKEIDDYLLTVAPNDSRVLAMTHKKYEHIFRTFGYEYMDPDYRTVMIRE